MTRGLLTCLSCQRYTWILLPLVIKTSLVIPRRCWSWRADRNDVHVSSCAHAGNWHRRARNGDGDSVADWRVHDERPIVDSHHAKRVHRRRDGRLSHLPLMLWSFSVVGLLINGLEVGTDGKRYREMHRTKGAIVWSGVRRGCAVEEESLKRSTWRVRCRSEDISWEACRVSLEVGAAQGKPVPER